MRTRNRQGTRAKDGDGDGDVRLVLVGAAALTLALATAMPMAHAQMQGPIQGQMPGQVQAPPPGSYGVVPVVAAAPPARAPLGISVSVGTRSDLLRSPGLDPFAGQDRLGQTVLAVGYRLGDVDAAGLSLGFEWNHGTSSAPARSAAAELTVDRLTLGIEARYPLLPRLAVFARVAPGLMRDRASLLDQSTPSSSGVALYGSGEAAQTKWSPAVDVGGGLAWRFADVQSPGIPALGFWVIADGGFGYTPAHQLTLHVQSDAQPGRTDEPLRLGSLSLAGAFARARLAVSF
jgi:hypothetical protein